MHKTPAVLLALIAAFGSASADDTPGNESGFLPDLHSEQVRTNRDSNLGHTDFKAFLQKQQVKAADCARQDEEGDIVPLRPNETVWNSIGKVTAEDLLKKMAAVPFMKEPLAHMKKNGTILCVEENERNDVIAAYTDMLGGPALLINQKVSVGWDDAGNTTYYSPQSLLVLTASMIHETWKIENHQEYGQYAIPDISDDLGGGLRLNRFNAVDNALAGLSVLVLSDGLEAAQSLARDIKYASNAQVTVPWEIKIASNMATVAKATQSAFTDQKEFRRSLFDSAFHFPGSFNEVDQTWIDTFSFAEETTEIIDADQWEDPASFYGSNKVGIERLQIHGARPEANYLEGGKDLFSDDYLQDIAPETVRNLLEIQKWLDKPRTSYGPQAYGYDVPTGPI